MKLQNQNLMTTKREKTCFRVWSVYRPWRLCGSHSTIDADDPPVRRCFWGGGSQARDEFWGLCIRSRCCVLLALFPKTGCDPSHAPFRRIRGWAGVCRGCLTYPSWVLGSCSPGNAARVPLRISSLSRWERLNTRGACTWWRSLNEAANKNVE